MPCSLIIVHIQNTEKLKMFLDDLKGHDSEYRNFATGVYFVRKHLNPFQYIEDLNRRIDIDPGDIIHVFNLPYSQDLIENYNGLDLENEEMVDWIGNWLRRL